MDDDHEQPIMRHRLFKAYRRLAAETQRQGAVVVVKEKMIEVKVERPRQRKTRKKQEEIVEQLTLF